MKGRPLYLAFLVGLLLVVTLLFLALYPGYQYATQSGSRSEVYLLYASSGSMVQLLNADQIDAFIVWEPIVSTATLTGTGRMIATPGMMPPPGEWGDTACCVLVLRNDTIRQNRNISALLSALTTAAVGRVNENQSMAENITADWVFGTKPLLTASGTLNPVAVEQQAFTNINFTSQASPPDTEEIGLPAGETNPGSLRMDLSVVEQGRTVPERDATPPGGR